MIINKNTYTVYLPSTKQDYDIFHVSLLDRYSLPVQGQSSAELHPVIVKETEKWEVNCILDSRQHYQTLHYLTQWAGYNPIRTSWEPVELLEISCHLGDKFLQGHPDPPQR
jgi:hypothetical protein